MWENQTSEESDPDLDLEVKNPKQGTKWSPGWELWKRVAVGFFCLSLYTLCYWGGFIFMKLIATAIGILIAIELLGLQTNKAKD